MKTCKMHIIADEAGNVLAAAALDDFENADHDADTPTAVIMPCDGQWDLIADLPEAVLQLSGPDFEALMAKASICPKDGLLLPKAELDKLSG